MKMVDGNQVRITTTWLLLAVMATGLVCFVPSAFGFNSTNLFTRGLVNIGNGNWVVGREDVALGNPGPSLDVVRFYNSRDIDQTCNDQYRAAPTVTTNYYTPAPFGAGWTASFNAAILKVKDSYANGDMVLFRDGTGAYYSFRYVGGEFVAPAVLTARLTRSGDNYTLTDKAATVYQFTATDSGLAYLQSITDSTAGALSISYSDLSQGKIANITAAGRTLEFEYYPNSQLVKKISVAGVDWHWDYYYDNIGANYAAHLQRVMGYGSSAKPSNEYYAYNAGGRLSMIQNGATTVTALYDADGRVQTLTPPERPLAITYAPGRTRVSNTASPSPTLVTTYTLSGGRGRVTEANNGYVATNLAWDAAGNMHNLTGPDGAFTLAYDGQSNLTSALTPTGDHAYTYPPVADFTPTRSQVANYTPPTGSADAVALAYSGNGNVSGVNHNGQTTQYKDYNSFGQPGQIVPPAVTGLAPTTLAYDAHGNMTSSAGASSLSLQYPAAVNTIFGRPGMLTRDGLQTAYSYEPSGGVTSAATTIDNLGSGSGATATTNNQYDANGRLIETTLADGTVLKHTYNAAGRVLSSSREGVVLGYGLPAVTVNSSNSYDGNGNRTQHTDELGNIFNYAYDNRDLLLSENWNERLAFGGSTSSCNRTYSYDAAGRPISTGGNAGSGETSEYNGIGQMVKRTADGIATTYAYDAFGRMTRWGQAGRETERTYDHLQTTTQSPGGLAEVARQDCLERTTSVARQDAATGATLGGTAYAFDGAGRPAQVATGSDRIPSSDNQAARTPRATAYGYDQAGHATAVTGPGSHRESRTYNNAGWVMSETVDGVTRHYAYDIMGRPIRETGPDGVIEREYNNQGLVLAEHCVERRYAYDALGRKISEVMPATGLRVEYEYSAVRGLLLRRTEKDTAGAVLREWRYGYNPRGSMLWEEAPGGYRKDLNYDAHNRLVQVSDNAGRNTTCAYNAHGEIESENNNGAVTAYEYDAAGRRVKVTRPDGTTAEYAYDGLGRATEQTDGAGTTFDNTFQPDRYQPTQTATAGLTLRTDWSPTNRPMTRQFGLAGENFNYTATDQLQRATWELPGHPNQSVAYTWSQNNLASLQYTAPTTYSYNADGNLRQVSAATLGPQRTLEYDSASRVRKVIIPGGDYITREYAVTGELANETLFDTAGSQKLSTSYAYDVAGNRIHEYIVEPTGERGYAHTFDVAGRITSSSDSYGNKREYEYDARGNRLVEREYDRSGLKTTANSTFSACDELLQRIITATSGKTATENYSYDGEGRLITKVVTGTLAPNLTTTYAWDAFSNLTQVSFSDTRPAVNYTYDGAHRRIKRECGGKVTLFVRDETTDNVIAELDGAGHLRAQYITGRTQDDLIAKQIYYDSTAYSRARTERIYYLDTSRPVRESMLLRSYGSEEQFFEEFGTSFPRASLYDLPRYCGKEFDPQTGLYAVSARWYDPQTGRFISRDPVEATVADLDYNPYSYCMNNPLKYTDPTGMYGETPEEYQEAMGDDSFLGRFSSYTYATFYGIGEAFTGTVDLAMTTGEGFRRIGGQSFAQSYEDFTTTASAVDDIAIAGLNNVGNVVVQGSAVERFRLAGNVWGFIEGVRLPAQVNALRYGVSLDYQELLGGHTLKKHVSISDKKLLERLQLEPRIPVSSTFTNQIVAERVIGETIQANQQEILSWLNKGAPGRLPLNYSGGDIIGRGIARGESAATSLSDAIVVLKAGENGKVFVLTAYPVLP